MISPYMEDPHIPYMNKVLQQFGFEPLARGAYGGMTVNDHYVPGDPHFIHYWRSDDGVRIFAQYDGGGAWKYRIYYPGGKTVDVVENNYESIDLYFRTGKPK